ncbi:MAG: ABC transporter permease [Bacteroidota bacterium]
MIRNYLTVALRNLWKRKAQTLINVFSLSLGLASAIIIFLIVHHELSFDRFHAKADQIYRIVTDFQAPDSDFGNVGVPRPLPEALKMDFPDVIAEVVPVEIYQDHKRVQVNEKTIFLDETIAYTKPEYFQLFDFPIQEGNPATVLDQPNEVMITASLGKKLFGRSTNLVGEVIALNDQPELQVVGVLADLPERTDLKFEMLLSFSTIDRNRDVDGEWDSFNSAFQVFVLLDSAASPDALQAQLTPYLGNHITESDGYESFLQLQPLSSIHFATKYGGPYRTVSRDILMGLALLGVILILLACINFINLATAVSRQRSKEIGVRKIVGSSRRQVVVYFLGEAFFVTLIAVSLALGSAELGLIQLRIMYPFMEPVKVTLSVSLIAFLLLLTGGVTLLAGFYPALVLSRFQPVHLVNRYGIMLRRRRITVRQVLVVFQFVIAQAFIIGVIIVGKQLQYMLEAPLGFNREAIVTVDFPDRGTPEQQRIKTTLQSHTGVNNLSLSMFPAISRSMIANSIGYDGVPEEDSNVGANIQLADDDYFATYEMDFMAGAPYTPADSGSGFVVNESFLKEVDATSPDEILGKYVVWRDLELPIVGVISDYHTRTFGDEIPPLLITNFSPNYQYLNIKVNLSQTETVVEQLQQLWQEAYPEFPFAYRFLDDAIAGYYREHQRLLLLTQLFSGIAIAIGCLGLYGLVLFMAEQRTKEVGIRKVLGASVQQLLALFSKEFLKLVIIAFCLAVPLAYFLMQQWLQSFVYRINIGFGVFAGCLLITLLLVIITVGYRSTQAALANPVDSLRNE